MCFYRRVVYSCNHSAWSREPVYQCDAQKRYRAGESEEPCTLRRSHPLITMRVAMACRCQGKAEKLDERLRQAKEIIKETKMALGIDDNDLHTDAGRNSPYRPSLSPTPTPTPTTSSLTTITEEGSMTHGESSENGGSAIKESLGDSATEFLQKRRDKDDKGMFMG